MSAVANLAHYRESRSFQGNHGGFVLAYRSMTNKGWYKSLSKKAVFMHCLLEAAYMETSRDFQGTEYSLEPGQIITSLARLADETGILDDAGSLCKAKVQVTRILNFFVKEGQLAYETVGKGNKKATLITVKNYAKFQQKSVTPTVTPIVTPEAVENKGLESDVVTPSVTPTVTHNNNIKNNISSNEDITSESRDSSSSSDESTKTEKLPNCPHKELLAIWAEVMPDKRQPNPDEWTPSRAGCKDLATRWKEAFTIRKQSTGEFLYTDKESGLTWWRRFFEYCRKSDFLRDQCKPFCLDWAVKRSNFIKIKEGAYHDHA